MLTHANKSETPRLSAQDVAFELTPMMNAAGRIYDAKPVYRLMVETDHKKAATLVKSVADFNLQRQKIEETIYEQAYEKALKQINQGATAIMVWDKGWHKGVNGIIANRLMRDFKMAVLVFSLKKGLASGSGRCQSPYDLMAFFNGALQDNHYATAIINGGGHKRAIGLNLSESALIPFQHYFNHIMEKQSLSADYQPSFNVDLLVDFIAIDDDLMNTLSHLEPFGEKAQAPLIAVPDVKISFAKILKQSHVKFSFHQPNLTKASIAGIGFGMAKNQLGTALFESYRTGDDQARFHLLGNLGFNEYKNVRSLQFLLRDGVRVQ